MAVHIDYLEYDSPSEEFETDSVTQGLPYNDQSIMNIYINTSFNMTEYQGRKLHKYILSPSALDYLHINFLDCGGICTHMNVYCDDEIEIHLRTCVHTCIEIQTHEYM